MKRTSGTYHQTYTLLTEILEDFLFPSIRFLLHEPIVWKFRDFKVFLKKLKKAHDKGNLETAKRLKENKPKYRWEWDIGYRSDYH